MLACAGADLPLVAHPRGPLTATQAALALTLAPGWRFPLTAQEISTGPWPYVKEAAREYKSIIHENKKLISVPLPGTAGIRIETGFTSSHGIGITALTATSARLQYAPYNDWFLCRVMNAQGTTLRIELDEVEYASWSQVRPLVAYGADPDDPALYVTSPSLTERLGLPKPSGTTSQKLPNTQGQAWGWVDDARIEAIPTVKPTSSTAVVKKSVNEKGRFVITHRFTASAALVAMRYPYTPGFHEHAVRRWREKSRAPGSPLRVIDVGHSQRGNQLAMLLIAGPGAAQDRQRPIVVIYGGEHGTEPDARWAAHGAAEFILSDLPRAVAMRNSMTTIIIPCLDPDAAGAPCYENLSHTWSNNQTTESRRLASPFLDLTNAGHRIDLVVDLHNIQGSQADWHGFSVLTDPDPGKRAAHTAWIQTYTKPLWAERGYAYKRTVPSPATPRFRLGGWLSYFLGATLIPVELNVQSRQRRLRLDEIQELGERLLTASHALVTSGTTAWTAARASGDRQRRERAAVFAAYPHLSPPKWSPITCEWETFKYPPRHIAHGATVPSLAPSAAYVLAQELAAQTAKIAAEIAADKAAHSHDDHDDDHHDEKPTDTPKAP